MSFAAPHSPSKTTLTGTVKWYRPDKGFGFLAPHDNTKDNSGDNPGNSHEDIFIHFSVVEHFGRETLESGDILICEVTPGKQGFQVAKILEITPNPNPILGPSPQDIKETLEGALKWYSPRKGFGFIQPDDMGGDIFLHITILRRLNLDNLDPGTRLRAQCIHSPRGREAISIEIL